MLQYEHDVGKSDRRFSISIIYIFLYLLSMRRKKKQRGEWKWVRDIRVNIKIAEAAHLFVLGHKSGWAFPREWE